MSTRTQPTALAGVRRVVIDPGAFDALATTVMKAQGLMRADGSLPHEGALPC